MFSVVLGCGEVCNFTLGSYKREEGIFGTQAYIPMTNTAFHQPQTVEARYVNGLQCAPPRRGTLDVALLSQYVRRMLAFHRWADTPAHLRAALEEHDARNAVITRAAALKVHQKLMTDRLLAGELSAAQARAQTAQFLARLDASDRTPLPVAPATPVHAGAAPVAQSRSTPALRPAYVPVTPPAAPLHTLTRVVSGGSTLSSPALSSSTLSYSPLSSPASSLGPMPAPWRPQHVNMVSPEENLRYGLREIHAHADYSAGEYLHHNLRTHPSNLEKHVPPVVTPHSSPQVAEKTFPRPPPQFSVHHIPIPYDKDEIPDYNRPVDMVKSKYLGTMYVQDALNTSGKALVRDNSQGRYSGNNK
jgi:hypothetical protein